jgi:hypothetical protein
MPDARTTIGALVTARATLVTHISECRRRFAGDLSTRRVVGVVLGVEHRRNPETGRAQRYVNAQYDLGEGFERDKALHISNIAVHVPAPAEENDGNVEAPVGNPPVPPNRDLLDGNGGDDNAPNGRDEHGARQDIIGQINLQAPDLFGAAVATPHDLNWYKCDAVAQNQMNGPVAYRAWHVVVPVGDHWSESCNLDGSISRLDVFLQMFPRNHLQRMVSLTNKQLSKYRYAHTTCTEILKLFGLWVLGTKFKFNE